jgi:hypothetical protein
MSRCSIKSKEFKQRLNQRLYEREVEQRLQEEQKQRDKKLEDEKRKFQETVESLKYDWRKEMYPELPPQESVKMVEERRVKVPNHLKYDWRKELNEGMTSSGVFFNDYQSTGDVNLETIFAGNQDSFIFNGVGTEVASGGFDSSSGNYLQFDGVALPIEGGSYSRDAIFVSANTETYTHITLDAFIGNNSNGAVTPNNDLFVYWYSDTSGGLLGFIPKNSSSGRFSFELPAEARGKDFTISLQELNPPLYSERLKGQIIAPVHPSEMNESASIICSQILLNYDYFDINNIELTTLLFQLWRTLQDEYNGGGWPTVPGYPSPAEGLTQAFGGDDYVMLWNAILNDFSDTLITIDGVKYGKNPLTYGVTNLNFQRRTPVSVLVPLDSPEAVSFIRVGSDVKTGTPGERYRKVMEQLKASKDYTTTKFGSNFPGSNPVPLLDIKASPIGNEQTYDNWSQEAEKNAQQSASTFNQSQQSTQGFDISKMEKDYGNVALGDQDPYTGYGATRSQEIRTNQKLLRQFEGGMYGNPSSPDVLKQIQNLRNSLKGV